METALTGIKTQMDALQSQFTQQNQEFGRRLDTQDAKLLAQDKKITDSQAELGTRLTNFETSFMKSLQLQFQELRTSMAGGPSAAAAPARPPADPNRTGSRSPRRSEGRGPASDGPH